MVLAVSAGYAGGNLAEISINNVPVAVESNEHNHSRGLHIVIINAETGKVEMAKAFDTYKTSAALEASIAKGVTAGRIVVAACKDDCVTRLSWEVRRWFGGMGSEEIWDLEVRHGWAFIGTSGPDVGDVEANENRATLLHEQVAVS